MEQYINKSALIAEIEKCYNECLKRAKISDLDYWNAKADAYRNVLVILSDTTEVKEVDLDKEIKRFTMSKELYETKSVIRTVAKHFFELGMRVNNPITAADRGMVEEIIINLKRVEQDYNIDLTREIEWLRSKTQKGIYK